MNEVLEAASKAIRRRESAVLCIVVKSEGSTPRHIGSKMLVFPDGGSVGTIGGGDLEHRVLLEAAQSLVDGKARTLRYALSDPGRGDPGICGGQLEVFVDPILPSSTVVIIGAGHVGKAVAHLAKWLRFRVVVSDDRQELCNKEGIPDGDEFHVCAIQDLASRVKIDAQTFLVLTTRAYSVDVAGLPTLLDSPAAYIGVIGSRRRWQETLRELEARGIPRDRVARVHSPMGIDLEAETPEEIAVSIMGQVLMIRNRGTGGSMATSQKDLAHRGDE